MPSVFVIPNDLRSDICMDRKGGPRYDLAKPYCITRFGVYRHYDFKEITDKNMDEKKKEKNFKFDSMLKSKVLKLQYFVTDGSFQEGKVHTYNPIDEDGLFLKVAELDISDTKKSLDFFKKYGLLGAQFRKDTSINDVSDIMERYENFAIQSDDSISCSEAIASLAEAIQIWDAIREKKIDHWNYVESISLRYGRLDHVNIVFPKTSLFVSDKNISDEELDHSNPYHLARRYLQYLINRNLTGVFESAVQLVNDQFVPAVTFATILDVAWWQFKQAVLGNIGFNHCLNCGSRFAVRHASQKFCPPRQLGKRSTCENTYNQRQRRAAKREKSKLTKNPAK